MNRTAVAAQVVVLSVCLSGACVVDPEVTASETAAAFLRGRLEPIREILAPNPRVMVRDERLRPLVAALLDLDDDRVFDELPMTSEQRDECRELLDVYHRGVFLVLVSELLHYQEVGVEESNTSDGESRVTVSYLLEGGSPAHVEIHYLMRRAAQGWRIVDLTINDYRSLVEGAFVNEREMYARGGVASSIHNLRCAPQVLTVEPARADSACPPISWPGWPGSAP